MLNRSRVCGPVKSETKQSGRTRLDADAPASNLLSASAIPVVQFIGWPGD